MGGISKGKGDENVHVAHGRVWIFSGITHSGNDKVEYTTDYKFVA